MAYLIVRGMTLPNWQWGGSTGYIRTFSSQSFYEATTSAFVPQGTPTNFNSFCQEDTVSISGTDVTLPNITLATTIDSNVPNAVYTTVVYDQNNVPRITLLSQYFVDPDAFQVPTEGSVLVTGAGEVALIGYYSYRGLSSNMPYYNLVGESDSTTLFVIKNNGSEWKMINGAGVEKYHTSDNPADPWDGTWVVTGGATLPVPTVAESILTTVSTWEQLTISNQSFTGPVVPPQWPGPFWNEYQVKEYVNSLVGDGTTPYAAELIVGKTALTQDPASPTNPIAIGANDYDWQTITEQVIWLSGREYQNDFADAVTGIGSTPTTLIITESTAVTATVVLPSTLQLLFWSGGKLNISGGQTVTVGNLAPTGSQQIFTGSGTAVFAKNATGGVFNLSWWAGVSNAGDCTAYFTQAATSLTTNTGGTLYVPPGVWKMDGMTVPSGSFVVGAGANTDSTSGTVIKPYSTSAIDLFTFGSGVTRSGLRNMTVTTTGTVSSSSRCVRILGSATTIFGLEFDEVHFEADLASSILVNFDDVASNNYEIVDVLFNHCLWEVPASGTAIKWESNNTTTTMIQPSIICGAEAKCFHVGQAGGGGGWIHVLSLDARGPGSFASSTSTDRTITGSIDGGTGVLTLTSGALVQNDVGQPFTRGAATGYITDLLTSTTCNTDYSGASVGAGTLTMSRFTPSTLMASCVWHIVGDHNTITCSGDADEGFQYFLINDASTNVSPMTFNGMTIQSAIDINAACVLVFNGCSLRSQTFTDEVGITGSLFFNGCSWDKNTVNIISDGLGGLTTTEITIPRWQGVIAGATRCYTDLSFHEGLQEQSIETQTNFYDRRDGSTNPLVVMASASDSNQAALRIGKLDPYTYSVQHYYDFYRDDEVDGWLEIEGSQAAPFKGIRTNCNIQTTDSTFVGGEVSPAQITASQNNYNPGNSSYLVRLSSDASRNITGIGLTTTQRGGEMHEFVNVGSQPIVFVNQSGSSTAADRFQCDGNADITMRQYERVLMTYDATTARWRVSKLNITGLTSNGTTITATLPFSTLDVTGDIGLGGALAVTGTAAFDDAVSVAGTLTMTGGSDIAFSGTTGQSKINLTDNLANALAVAEGATDYLRFVTSNGSEAIHVNKALLGINPLVGIGYGTGAGGAVTQAASRTTGVTLNTLAGAITLVSAAGSTTPASFTVTNSAVAATDTIILNQKSGTDLYDLSVSAVGAGSFQITFNTKSGTTVEQPVFNFSVIKAVAA